MPESLIISERNVGQFLQEHRDRFGCAGVKPRTVPLGQCLNAKPFADTTTLIDESEWLDRIKEMDAAKAWPNDQRRAVSKELGKSVVKFQGAGRTGLNYCHLFALANCIEVVRYQQGLGYIELAPESMGGVVNWQNEGGVMDEDIAYAAKHGVAARSFVPKLSIDPRTFEVGWEQNALCHLPLEWDELGHENMRREVVTALLLGRPIYGGWIKWEHSVMGGKLIAPSTKLSDLRHEIENSWDSDWGNDGYGELAGDMFCPDAEFGCYAPRVVTFSAE
ncbi:MAG: hypothetical protein LLG00_16705 [Planctomycetaceae bacterium]|nr:hypothetical protein [Planctomycetaceae bacterium]